MDVDLTDKAFGPADEIKTVQTFLWGKMDILPGMNAGSGSAFIADSGHAVADAYNQAKELRKVGEIPGAETSAYFTVEVPVPGEGWYCWLEGSLVGGLPVLSAVFRNTRNLQS